MDAAAGPTVKPLDLHQDEGEALWVFGVLATIKASAETTGGRVAVIEHLAPQGAASPLHVHHRENEWFYILDGDVTFWVGGKVIEAGAGSFVYGPREIPHTFLVTSPQAHFLIVTEPAGFEGFLRKLAEPAQTRTIPPANVTMPPPERMTAIAAEYGIDILGPPGIPGQCP